MNSHLRTQWVDRAINRRANERDLREEKKKRKEEKKKKEKKRRRKNETGKKRIARAMNRRGRKGNRAALSLVRCRFSAYVTIGAYVTSVLAVPGHHVRSPNERSHNLLNLMSSHCLAVSSRRSRSGRILSCSTSVCDNLASLESDRSAVPVILRDESLCVLRRLFHAKIDSPARTYNHPRDTVRQCQVHVPGTGWLISADREVCRIARALH